MNKQYFVKMGIISFVLLAGCAYHEYEIEVNPQGKEFERKLTVRRWEYGSTDSSSDSKRYLKKLSDDEIQRLVQLYETRLTGDDSKEQSFVGRFKSRTPSDVGGSGSYIHLASPIGALGGYVEKFRGDDDLAAQLHKIQAASDRLANLITAWFEAELQDDPRIPFGNFVSRSFAKISRIWVCTFGGQIFQMAQRIMLLSNVPVDLDST